MNGQKQLVQRMRFIMRENRISQETLAKKLGISRSAISRILTLDLCGPSAIEHLRRGISLNWSK